MKRMFFVGIVVAVLVFVPRHVFAQAMPQGVEKIPYYSAETNRALQRVREISALKKAISENFRSMEEFHQYLNYYKELQALQALKSKEVPKQAVRSQPAGRK